MNWLPIKSDDFDVKSKGKRDGIHFEVSMSPYDIPQKVRGFFCKNRKRFVIEFKYLTDEATKQRKLTPEVVASEGIKSGRLYTLEVDIQQLGVDKVSLLVKPLIEQALEKGYGANPELQTSRRFDRREINRHLLEKFNDRYIGELATAG